MTGAEAVNGQFDPEHVATGAASGLTTEIDTFGVSATLALPFENFQFTSITAYEELDKFLQDDGDGTAVVFFDKQYSADAEQFTQELRVDGATASMGWVAGLYYYDDVRDLRTEAPTTADGLWHQELVDLDTRSWAVFGQVEYDLSAEFTLVAGLRYTDEERDFSQRSGPSFYSPIVEADDDLSESATTGRLGLDWRPRENTLAYANVSTGFKSGGFSGSYNALQEATRPVTSEDVINYELGLKTQFADGKVRWQSLEGTYPVEAFVRNLTDEEYFTYQNTLGPDWGYAVWGKPRTAGVRLAMQL